MAGPAVIGQACLLQTLKALAAYQSLMNSSNAPLLLAVAGIGKVSGGSLNCLLGHEHGKLLSGSHSPFGWRTLLVGGFSPPDGSVWLESFPS